MERTWMFAVICGLTLTATTAGQEVSQDLGRGEIPVAAPPRFISFGHDPNCPGCQAFLAGQVGDGVHSPGCAAGGGEAGKGEAVGGGAGETFGPTTEPGLDADLLAADYGTGFGYDYAVPGMIGDFFGGTTQLLIGSAGQGGSNFFGSPDEPNPAGRSNVSIGGGDRRFKVAENYSPYPLDRIFFNYNSFHNALRTVDGRDANFHRGVFGFEKTFFQQLLSLEARLPMGSGLNNTQTFHPTADNVAPEFGNVALAIKGLLWRTNAVAVSAGMGVVLPTAAETNVLATGFQAASIPGNSDGEPMVVFSMSNDAYYLQPFVGVWYTPTDRCFVQFAGQLDFDACGNRVDMLDNAGVLRQAGILQDQTLLFLDASLGYWLFRNPGGDGWITGIAPMIELHYSSTVSDPDAVDASSLGRPSGIDRVTDFNGHMDILNLTTAARLELFGSSYLTFLAVAPLRTGEEKLFDAEFGVQYTRRY